jgi:hypothetical protein
MRWRISYSPAAAERSTLGMRLTVCPTLNLCITILSILISGCYISLARAAETPSNLQTVYSAESNPKKSERCPVATLGGSLPELINERGRSVIQIIERMPLTMIINPNHQYFSVFSSRHVTLGLGSVLIECGYKAKNPGRSGRCKRIVIPTTFNPGNTRNIPLP